MFWYIYHVQLKHLKVQSSQHPALDPDGKLGAAPSAKPFSGALGFASSMISSSLRAGEATY